MKIQVNGQTFSDIQLVVFDKDGTLVDLYPYWLFIVQKRAEKICDFLGLDPIPHRDALVGSMGIDLEGERLRPGGPVGFLPREEVREAAVRYLKTLPDLSGNLDAICTEAFLAVDRECWEGLQETIRPLPGAVELLREIKDCGGRIGIATLDLSERAEMAMRTLGVSDLVDCVIGVDQVSEGKPNPEMLRNIGEKLGISPEASIMVGDADRDIQMGSNADFAASIAVVSGLSLKETLVKLTPFVVDGISEIKVLSS